MRVKCQSFEEFLDCLENLSSDGEGIEGGVIRVSNSHKPKTEFSRYVDFQISTIVNLSNSQGQYLLECGVHCGVDYDDSGGLREGSEKAKTLRHALEDVALRMGLKIRPGVIEI